MPEELGGAVLESQESTQVDISADESSQSTADEGAKQVDDRQDGRKQPDALRKHIAELRRDAEAITDPAAKKAAQDRIKFLYDTSGKARGYEEQFSTVREAREVKALLDAVGGRDGFQKMQTNLAEIEKIDAMLSAGDAQVIDRMWQEAPEGMPKLVPHILDRFAKEKPQEYQQFIAPKSIGYLDQSGFPQAFDRMVKLYEAGKTEDAQSIRDELIGWVVGNRQQAQQAKQVDPEVERLRNELNTLKQGDQSKKVNDAYNAVIDHAGPSIDKVLKPMVAKLGLSAEGYAALRSDVWNHLQDTRNANDTYKTIAPAKQQRQGYNAFTDYAKRWTDDNAEASARAMVKARYGHQMQNGAKPAVTNSPATPKVQTGKEPPARAQVDYGAKGVAAARKAGFKDVGDMLLSGQAPLIAGGIYRWR